MKRNILILMFLLGFVDAMSQEIVVEQEVVKKKEINNIKLTERAMYAEVIELAADDEEAISLAQQKSINKLQTNVIEACAQKMNMSKEGVKEIFDIIDDKCQNVVIKKGDMVRVFAYIAKDAVGLGRRKPKQKDLDEIFGPEEEDVESDSVTIQKAIDNAVVQVMGKSDSINYNSMHPQYTSGVNVAVQQATQAAQQAVAQTVVQPAQASQTVVVVQQPAQSSAASNQSAQTIVVVQQPAVAPTTVVSNPVHVQPAVVPQPAPNPEVVQGVVVPALCQTMIEKKNLDNLMLFLKQEKDYHHLMFGNSKAMQYPEKCYIVLLDKSTKNIVSVLDKGESERMNFVTKKMDRYSNYRGGNYAAVFVQEY